LTTPVIADGDAGLTITSVDQTDGSAVATVPDLGDAADSFVMVDVAQTLTNKTLTAPIMTAPGITFGVSAHDYAAGHADWTLDATEQKSLILTTTNVDTAANIIAPLAAGKIYIVYNGSGENCVIKVAAETGITIATLKTAIVRCGAADYIRVTADV